jgi:hypothetical protein
MQPYVFVIEDNCLFTLETMNLDGRFTFEKLTTLILAYFGKNITIRKRKDCFYYIMEFKDELTKEQIEYFSRYGVVVKKISPNYIVNKKIISQLMESLNEAVSSDLDIEYCDKIYYIMRGFRE